MSFFLAFCNNEEDTQTVNTTVINRNVGAETDEEILRLNEQLREEQERSAELTRSNDALTLQIQSLKQQLSQYDENINQDQQTGLQQLLKQKESQLSQIEENYAKSQQKVTELEEELEQSKILLNTETTAHQQLQKQNEKQYNTSIELYQAQIDEKQQQYEELQKKYRDIETQRNELLTQTNDDDSSKFMEQLKSYQTQCKENDETISDLQETLTEFEKFSKEEIAQVNQENEVLKDEQSELEEKLDHETRRADGIQELLDTKTLDIIRLEDEVDRLNTKIEALGGADKYKVVVTTETGSASPTNKVSLPPLNGITLPLDYFRTHLNDYKNNAKVLLKIWNKVDIDTNEQITLNAQSLNIILSQFIRLIKVKYVDEHIEDAKKYSLTQKQSVDVSNEAQIFELKADVERGVMNRDFIKDKQIITKTLFLEHFISFILDVEYKNKIDGDNTNNNDNNEEKKEFDELKYISTGPTVIGVNKDAFDATEYVSKVHEAIDTLTNNPKERIRAAVDILIKCNDSQRKQIADVDETSDVRLESKFRLYSNNKKVLKVLDLMMKPLSDCDAQWIYKAIDKKNEDIVIEILFSRTNAQIEALRDAYNRLYDKDLSDDIAEAFNKKDEAFVSMCNSLLVLNKRGELAPKEVNIKWANNDAKRLKEYLCDNNDDNKAWDTLFDLVSSRSWSHLDETEKAFNNKTKVALLYRLKKANATKSIARKAVLTALESAHSMHGLYASYLQQTLKKKSFGSGIDDDALQRILLSRSQIDLADIDHEFTNNDVFGEGKTTRQWIEDCTQSSLYQYILLSLLGLSDIQIKDRSEQEQKQQQNEKQIDTDVPGMYRDGLVTYNPSIKAKPPPFTFNAAKDANEIATWINEFNKVLNGDTKALKEKLAELLTARNAEQRGLILAEYPAVMTDIYKKLKKGQVVTLCGGFLKPSIAAYEASVIEKAMNNNNINKIGDVLCSKNNAEISAIIFEYKRLRYKAADLVQSVRDLCERNKRGSVAIILDSLLRCVRDETASVDMSSVSYDIDFLMNTAKFKAEEKKRLVEIFCNNNWRYIRAINRQYGMRSSSMNLEKLIKEKVGTGSGNITLALLKYSCDPIEYFVSKLFDLGLRFDKNKQEIARIFLIRSEIDLNEIRARFANTSYGKQLDAWVEDKAKGSKFGIFLKKILTSIDEYNVMMNEYNKLEEEKAVVISDNDSINNNENTDDKTAKPKYENTELQNEILNDETKKEQSLTLFKSGKGGIIKFLSKYLQSKIVEKMWTKLDSEKRGYIEMSSFPDIMAFVVILYKVKIHQQKTKTKSKPKLDNKAVRAEIEHCAVWIAKIHIYDDDHQFKLSQHDFQNKLPSWCQNYVDKNGEL